MHFQSLLIAGLSASTIALILPKPEIGDVKPPINGGVSVEKTNADDVNASGIKLIINTGDESDFMDSKDTKMGSRVGAKDDEDMDSKSTKMRLGVGPNDDKDIDSKGTKMKLAVGAKDDEDMDSKGTKMRLGVGPNDDKDIDSKDTKMKLAVGAKDNEDMDSKDTKMRLGVGPNDDKDIDSKGTKMKLAVGANDDKDKDENEDENVKAKGVKDNGQDEEKEATDGKDLSTKDRDDKISADKGDNDDDDEDEVDTKTNSKINYGKCSPAMSFKEGRPGREPDESTFLPDDQLVAKGQQDAFNPNIITNRICDQLVNVCEANDAAIEKCKAGKAKIIDLGTRDETTAKAWNDFLIV